MKNWCNIWRTILVKLFKNLQEPYNLFEKAKPIYFGLCNIRFSFFHAKYWAFLHGAQICSTNLESYPGNRFRRSLVKLPYMPIIARLFADHMTIRRKDVISAHSLPIRWRAVLTSIYKAPILPIICRYNLAHSLTLINIAQYNFVANYHSQILIYVLLYSNLRIRHRAHL